MRSTSAHQPLRLRLASFALAAAAALGLAAGLLTLLSRAAIAQAQPPEASVAAAAPRPALAPAATIQVTHTGNAGFGSLRAAINLANFFSGADTITFNLAGCPCVIALVTSLPTITETLTISGPGADLLAVDGGGSVRVVDIEAAPVSLAGLTVQNGYTAGSGGGLRSDGPLTLTNVHVLSNTAVGQGGGLYASDALVLVGGEFRGNQSTGNDGGALLTNDVVRLAGTAFISNTAEGYGGAIYGDTLIASGGWFERNHSEGEGGALYLNTLVLTDTVIISNTAVSYGGGAYAGDTQISGGQFVDNHADGDAGGLGSGSLVISGTTFLRNTAADGGDGGGLYAEGHTLIQGAWFEGNHADGRGGAVQTGSPLTISASTFIDNRADAGGALYASNGWLANVLLAGNVATSTSSGSAIHISTVGVLHLAHLTVVGNAAPNSRAIVLQGGATVITNTIFTSYTIGLERRGGTASEDYSLFFNVTTPTSGTVGGGANRFTGDPAFVDPSADDYHLRWGSAALEVGLDAGISTDFDGETRPQEGGFDLGFDELFVRRLYLPLATR